MAGPAPTTCSIYKDLPAGPVHSSVWLCLADRRQTLRREKADPLHELIERLRNNDVAFLARDRVHDEYAARGIEPEILSAAAGPEEHERVVVLPIVLVLTYLDDVFDSPQDEVPRLE